MPDNGMLDFESRHEPLAPLHIFRNRLLSAIYLAVALVFVSLLGGMLGYHRLEGMSWTDAYLNAAMILSGMGPIGSLNTEAGKIFAGSYALYSGLVVVVSTGIILAPVVHRFLHRFHVIEDDKGP